MDDPWSTALKNCIEGNGKVDGFGVKSCFGSRYEALYYVLVAISLYHSSLNFQKAPL